jgi:hypothetical protein
MSKREGIKAADVNRMLEIQRLAHGVAFSRVEVKPSKRDKRHRIVSLEVEASSMASPAKLAAMERKGPRIDENRHTAFEGRRSRRVNPIETSVT